MFKFSRRRFFVLEEGKLSWWESEPTSSAATTSRKGWVNLSKTPCEVEAVAGSKTKFVLKPLEALASGWSQGHFTGSQGRVFELECLNMDGDRAEWLEALIAHSKYKPRGWSFPIHRADD